MRCVSEDELLDHAGELLDLLVEQEPTLRKRPQRMLAHLLGRVEAARSECCAVTGERALGVPRGLGSALF